MDHGSFARLRAHQRRVSILSVIATPPIRVAVGALGNAVGEVLITRRRTEAHQGGLWEFPGGKVETGEDVKQALARELNEELGITVLNARPLIRVHHHYSDKDVELDVWRVDRYSGSPRGMEAQPIKWVAPELLRRYQFPAADGPIINALRLPSEYLITGEPGDQPPEFLHRLSQALDRGVRLVQLRAKCLPDGSLRRLYRSARAICAQYSAPLLLNGTPEMAREINADGVHLTSDQLMSLRSRPLGAHRWVAASCHDPKQVYHACQCNVDFIVVSPVRSTTSHRGVVGIGWSAFHRLTEAANVPVYALGGMRHEDLKQAWVAGGQGIAAISGLWNPAPAMRSADE